MPVQRMIMPESECDRRDYKILSTACDWMGIEIIWADHRSLEGIPPDCPTDGTALHGGTSLHGGTTFCRQVAQLLGGHVLEPPDDFLPSLPSRFVNRHIELTTLAQARSLKEPRFIKPVNDKFFPAAVYDWGTDVPATKHGDDIAVLISDPVTWQIEYRLFVLDREIHTLSPYLWPDSNRPDAVIEAQAIAFGRSVLADAAVACPRAVVIDVGIIEGIGWSVIEANTAVMSGIYDCEPAAVLEVLEAGWSKPSAHIGMTSQLSPH